MTDLGALAGYDLSKLPDAKRAGEEIIRIIQQELLLRFGNKEVATIPEEEAQKLLVGVGTHNYLLVLLFISTCQDSPLVYLYICCRLAAS